MKLDQETIKWIENKIKEICENGFGRVSVTRHIKTGQLDGIEKKAIQTEKSASR